MCGATLKSFELGFCPKYFLGVALHMGSQEKTLGEKANDKNFQGTPRQKNSKREKILSFPHSARLTVSLMCILEGSNRPGSTPKIGIYGHLILYLLSF